MNPQVRVRVLRLLLALFGVILVAGVYPLMLLWPAGWSFTPSHPEYEHMILAIYATLGIFLLMAARDPWAHRSLIWFTVWSSLVHGGVMAYYALTDLAERGHLFGDVPGLLFLAISLGLLMRGLPEGADDG